MQRNVYSDPAWRKCPAWVRERVHAYVKTRIDSAYEFGALVWCVAERNGVRYHKFDECPEELKAELRAGPSQGFHYWKSTGVRFF